MVKDNAIAIAKSDLCAVKYGIIISKWILGLIVKMDSSNNVATITVEGVAAKYGMEKCECDADAIVDVVDLSISGTSTTFRTSKGSRKIGSTLGIVNKTL
jgi:hypothetical protein